MLSAVLLAVALSAAAVSAGPALTVSLSGADTVSSRSDAVVSTTVTNTGDEAVDLLNHPGTVLAKGPTDAFTISSSDGKTPRFQGLFAKYIPGPDKTFTTLEPGQSVTVEHSLADAYDFSSSGAGTYDIKPSTSFYARTADGVQQLTADVESPHSAALSGAIVKPGGLQQYIVPVKNCSAAQQLALQKAAQGADGLVHEAVRSILAEPRNKTHYTTWFGDYSASGYSKVSLTYTNLIKGSFVFDVSYECLAAEQCAGLVDSDAFTLTDAKGHIWACPGFFYLPLNGTDSQAGVLLNLATHWNDVAHTGNWAIGQDNSEELARNVPGLAVDNADSYEYYAETNPLLAQV